MRLNNTRLLNQHTGNNEPEGSFLHDFAEIEIKKDDRRRNISINIRYKKSPSVVSCTTNIRRFFLSLNIKCKKVRIIGG